MKYYVLYHEDCRYSIRDFDSQEDAEKFINDIEELEDADTWVDYVFYGEKLTYITKLVK
jgi:hypothetical protein